MRCDGSRRPGVEQEGRLLVERLGGRWRAEGGMCRCPAHDDRTPSLSIRPGRRRLLFHCFAGCDASAILRALEAKQLLLPGGPCSDEPERRRPDPLLHAAARRLWSDSRPIAGTPAEAYLAARGLAVASAELRYNAQTPHGPRPFTRFRPALLAAVRDEAGLVAVHRTFLDAPAGRPALLAQPRAGLGGFGRGAVRLGGCGPRLGLAEGIETALSASLLFGMPCWATLGTERFRLVALPLDVRELHLFLDHDRGGRRAERLARKAFGHVARIECRMPVTPGEDWNDVLRESAAGRTAGG